MKLQAETNSLVALMKTDMPWDSAYEQHLLQIQSAKLTFSFVNWI